MSVALRAVLVVVSVLTAFFVIRKIRKSQFKITDSLYWIFFCIFVLVLSIFPQITYYFSGKLGFESPSNFVFVFFIFLLLIKIFLSSVKISKLENTLSDLIQKYAIDHQHNKPEETDEKTDEK